MGTYKGFEIYNTRSSSNVSLSTNVLTIAADGKFSGQLSGTLSSEDSAKTNGVISVGRYAYICTEGDLLVIRYSGSNTTTWDNDAYIAFRNYADISSAKYSCAVVDGKLVSFVTVLYKDGTTKNVLVANDSVIFDVTFTANGAACDGNNCASTSVVTIAKNGSALYVWKNKTLVGSDGKAGTYTGNYGAIVLDGFGTLTISSETTAYTLDGNNITFVIGGKKLVVVALGEGTYTKVSDGYNGTYTLPDNAGTITLDGFGGAGEGKTYVVKGTNITIYDGETSTTYGLDVANNALLGKSKFAGLTFTKSSANEIKFDDSSSISGTMLCGSSGWTVTFAEGVLEGNELTVTITAQVGTGATVGAKIVFTVNGSTLVLKSGTFPYVTDYVKVGNVYTCEGFSL